MRDEDITEEWVLDTIAPYDEDDTTAYHFTVYGNDDPITDFQLDKIFRQLNALRDNNEKIAQILEIDFSGNNFQVIPDSLIHFIMRKDNEEEIIVMNFLDCNLGPQALATLMNLRHADATEALHFNFKGPVDEEFIMQFIRNAMLTFIKMHPDSTSTPKKPDDASNFNDQAVYYKAAVALLFDLIETYMVDSPEKVAAFRNANTYTKPLSTFNRERLKTELQWDLIPRGPGGGTSGPNIKRAKT